MVGSPCMHIEKRLRLGMGTSTGWDVFLSSFLPPLITAANHHHDEIKHHRRYKHMFFITFIITYQGGRGYGLEQSVLLVGLITLFCFFFFKKTFSSPLLSCWVASIVRQMVSGPFLFVLPLCSLLNHRCEFLGDCEAIVFEVTAWRFYWTGTHPWLWSVINNLS